MNENSQDRHEQDFGIPPKLAAALKDVSSQKVFVPPYVDSAILKAARQRMDKGAKTPRFRRWMLWPALAAACTLIFCVVRLLTTSGHSSFVREDLNHDGKVDILDSFALARELKSSKRLPATYDVNGDGVVDERDVRLITAHAVQLNKGNGS